MLINVSTQSRCVHVLSIQVCRKNVSEAWRGSWVIVAIFVNNQQADCCTLWASPLNRMRSCILLVTSTAAQTVQMHSDCSAMDGIKITDQLVLFARFVVTDAWGVFAGRLRPPPAAPRGGRRDGTASAWSSSSRGRKTFCSRGTRQGSNRWWSARRSRSRGTGPGSPLDSVRSSSHPTAKWFQNWFHPLSFKPRFCEARHDQNLLWPIVPMCKNCSPKHFVPTCWSLSLDHWRK